MSVMIHRKSCVRKGQLYQRIANKKVNLLKELIVSNSQDHNQAKNVKHKEIEQDYEYNTNKEIIFDNTIDNDTISSDNEAY